MLYSCCRRHNRGRAGYAQRDRQAWHDLDHVDVQAELRQPVPTLQDVPPFLRAGVRRAYVFALQEIGDADLGKWVGLGITRLTPRMLLARPGADGPVGRRLLHKRVDRYDRGDWPALYSPPCATPLSSSPR